MMPGWIKLHRKIMENDLWLKKPFSEGQAWIDLLLLANFEDKKISMNGEEILIKRGSFVTSIRKLSERWGWSRGKTARFLDEHKTDRMLDIKRAGKMTIIEIVNYAEYQGFSEASEKKRANKKAKKEPVNEHKTDTTKEIKNITSTVTLTPPVDTGALVTTEEDDDFDWDSGWIDPNADLGGSDGDI